MKRFQKEFKRKGRYREKGDIPGEANFEDVSPKDLPASYGVRSQEYSPGFHKRAYRDLVFGRVTVSVNPTAEAGEMADPYPIIGPVNRVIDAQYNGQDNTSGSVCPQLALGSGSNFLNIPDIITEEVIVNYNYCKHIASDNASAETNKSYDYPWADIDSSIQSEAYYDLPFFGWIVSGSTYYSDTLLDIVDFYQIVLQAAYQIPLRYKVLRSMEKELKDMCYKNGDAILNDVFGRLKKATLINTINGISDAVSTHYFDTKWLEETSLLLAQPCKKAVGMLDPLIEIQVKYTYNNNLTVKDANNKTLFSTSAQEYADLFSNINSCLENLSLQKVLHLARNNADYTTIQNWMNAIVDEVAAIKNCMKVFTTHFQDMDVAFKRMSKAGYTNWKIGQFLLVNDISETFKPVFNKMVYDIVRTTFTGARDITYDAGINQWKSYSIWDKYLGLPSYDEKSGGSVLTFSTKTVVNSSGLALAYPAWFKFNSCTMQTRKGETYNITIGNLQVNTGAIARVLGRLSPISTTDATYFHIPEIDVSTLSSNPVQQAWIIEAVQHVFGYCKATVATNTFNYCISDDILTSVDFIVDDLTNAIDTMGRLNAPFRVLKAETEPLLGVKR